MFNVDYCSVFSIFYHIFIVNKYREITLEASMNSKV